MLGVMLNRLAAPLLCIGLCCVQAFASAAEPSGGGSYQPCSGGGEDYAAAQEEIAAIDKQIRALKPESDHRAANEALMFLLDQPCMRFAGISSEALRAEAAPALIDFWTMGGWQWVGSVVDLGESREQRFPSPMRRVLAPETYVGFPAPELLCPLDDDACGRETAGWWLRAENFLKLAARQAYRRVQYDEVDCRDWALSQPALQQYAEWSHCVETIPKLRDAMPLGHLKAPTSGWLVLRGRRGHYSYCDEVRMYSLATGSAYMTHACSALALGGVKPEVARKVSRGTVSVENLRELAWMLLQLKVVTSAYPADSDTFRIPENLVLEKEAGGPAVSDEGYETFYLVSSNQTGLAWALTSEKGAEFASGSLTWPEDHNRAAASYATSLLQVAEAGFEEGCPPESLPSEIGVGQGGAWVSQADASAEALTQIYKELEAEMQRVAQASCARN